MRRSGVRIPEVTSFLAVTAAIFAAITVLLVLMSHLESDQTDRDREDGSSQMSPLQEATGGQRLFGVFSTPSSSAVSIRRQQA
jgi:hypothetical protein